MRKIKLFSLGCLPLLLASLTVQAQLSDITQPGDLIVPSSNNSPGSEGVANAIDNVQGTKYLNFDANTNGLPTGFTVTPSVGLSVVQCITLTSANDSPNRDPSSYTLEGSDDGTTFTLIAGGPVPIFATRFQRIVIPFTNNTPYRVYRVMFPTVVNAPTPANSMQIAEVELLGFVAPTDVTVPGDTIVPSSNNSPGSEGVANAIDNVQGTKYLNFDANTNGLPTGFTVTPGVGPTRVTGLTLTSANDSPNRDPSSYTLEGSFDGTTFFLISSGPVPVFPSRFFKNYIFFSNSHVYKSYRLMFPTVVNAPTPANSMQIAEVEFLGVAADLATDVTQPGDTIVPSSNNSPGSEGVANAIDNVTGTKYLNFDGNTNGLPTGFTVTPSVGLTIVNGLTLTSANDSPNRDPASYELSGSEDGTTFTAIASGSVPLFTSRFQKQIFIFENSTPYRIYRLMFPTVVNAPTPANSMQIAEVELLGVLAPTDVTVPGDPIVPSSNNSPGSEAVANAIDNVQGTKYLNFDANTNGLPTGFTVTPSVGDTIVSGLTLTSANDSPNRDPASYDLRGSNDGSNYVSISSGPVAVFPTRFYKNYIFFNNTKSFKSYRLMFPTVVNAPTPANSMQIAEVEFLGVTPGVVNTNVVNTLIRRQPSDTSVLLGSKATFRVLTGPYSVQWYRKRPTDTAFSAISGANSAAYTTPAAVQADDGTLFYALVQSSQGQQTSDTVMLNIFTLSTTESVALSWQGSGANGAPTAMLIDDITGVQKQPYWMNISGASGSLAAGAVLNSSNVFNPTISFSWSTSGEWGAGSGDVDAQARLYNGMDTSHNTASNAAQTVTFSGVPAGSHSLLIYTVQVPLEFFQMNFVVITHDGGGNEIVQQRFIRPMNADEYNPNPAFVLETSTDPNQRSVGSYMRFDNVQPGADGLILVKFWSPNWVSTLGNQPSRGPGLNAIQLVLNPPSVTAPPVITQQPLSANGLVGGQVTLSVEATGTGLTYQWLKNSLPIPGATGTQLVLSNLKTNDVGNYQVAVSNPGGTLRSRIAVVSILPDVRITYALITYFKFEDTGGTTTVPNSAAGGLDGQVINNNIPDYAQGQIGAALLFDFANEYVYLSDYNKPTRMTVSGWVQATADNQAGPVLRNWLDTCPGTDNITCHGTFTLDLGPDANNNMVYSLSSKIGVGPNLVTLSAPVNGSGFDWHHYAMTADGVTLTLYWDGQQVSTVSYLGSINAPPFAWLAVGAQLDGTGTQIPASPTWPGAMDDLAIWSRALDSREIGAIYNFGLQGTAVDAIPPLLGPPLSIVRSGANATISWSPDLTSFKLQSSPSLKNPNAVWTDVQGVVNNSVTVPANGIAYYRLAPKP